MSDCPECCILRKRIEELEEKIVELEQEISEMNDMV